QATDGAEVVHPLAPDHHEAQEHPDFADEADPGLRLAGPPATRMSAARVSVRGAASAAAVVMLGTFTVLAIAAPRGGAAARAVRTVRVSSPFTGAGDNAS